MPSHDAEQLFAALRAEYLAQLPETLVKFETQIVSWPAGSAASAELVREVHSLKGAAGTYGLGFVTDVCHHLEDFLAGSCAGEDHQAYLDGLLRYVDLMRDYVASVAGGGDRSGASFAARLDELSGPGPKSGLRVLIVEPAQSMSRAYWRLLDSRGVAASTTCSGYEALGRLVHDGGYGAVLTSYETSDISGLSLAKAVRAIDEIPRALKIILITSNDVGSREPAVNRLVRKDRFLEASLIDALRSEGLLH